MIHVLSYSPKEGERGVPITVHIHFNHSSSDAIFVRLVIGSKAVATKVRELPNDSYGRWQLDATIPSLDPSHRSDKVPLSVQALDQNNQILDSVTFGEFSYWLSDRSNCASPKSEPSAHHHRRHISLDLKANQLMPPSSNDTPALRRRAATTSGARPTLPGVVTPDSTGPSKSRSQKPTARRIRANSLMRSKFAPNKDSSDDLYPQTPILQLLTPLDSMCHNWDQSETRAGRRLVRFQKVQDGRKLIVSCEPIRQEDYNENDSVISCIHRDDGTNGCYVTSVDVIYLLERLTNDEFPVEEKNRIRRNLEGLRPTTVSKHKAGFEKFFQRIMEFPDPKPRNIEKDLKVFDWGLLEQALEKILSKYSVYTTESSPTDSTVSLPSEPNDDNLQPYHFDSHPGQHSGRHPFPKLAQPSPVAPSLDSFNERSTLLLSQDASDGAPHTSDHTYDTLQHYPLYPSDNNGAALSEQGSSQGGSTFGNWVSENGPPQGELGLDNYHPLSSYGLAEMSEGPNPGLPNETPEYGYDYSSGSLQFPRAPLTAYYS